MLWAVAVMTVMALLAAGVAAPQPAASPMPVGVDEAGSDKWIYDDPVAQDAFEQIGFDFVMHHFWGAPTVADIERLDGWAAPHGHGFLINPESSPSGREPGDPRLYRKPGGFFQPPPQYVQRCLASPHFLGFCFDECEHWICNGVWVTGGGPFMPHFYDAEGDTLADAYAGNRHNLQVLMDHVFAGFA